MPNDSLSTPDDTSHKAASSLDSKIQSESGHSAQPGLTKQGIKDAIEIGGKGLLGLVGLSYVLGLLVVTIHLRSYGLNSLSLTQLQYVTAGVWAILPVLLMMCFGVFAHYIIRFQDWGNKSSKQVFWKVIGNILGLLFALFTFFGVARGVVEKFGIDLTILKWLIIPAFGVFGFGLMAGLIFMLMSDPASQEPPAVADRAPSRLTVAVLFAVMAIFMSVTYIQLFARYTYPDIPGTAGGGRPSHVELVVATDAKAYLTSVGVNFSDGALPNKSDSQQLLLVTEKEYVIINPNGKAVSIPAESVKSVVYAK